jgi:hypothetical protein
MTVLGHAARIVHGLMEVWMRSLPLHTVALAVICLGVACEPEIGSPCDPDTEFVDRLVEQAEGTDNLVQDVRLDNCSQGFCASTNGSRPYCTKRCVADGECSEAGAGFVCKEIVAFGPLACQDYENPNLPRPGTEASGTPCTSSGDCGGDEICLGAVPCQDDGDCAGGTCESDADGNRVCSTFETCAIGGRDCLTGPEEGSQSLTPLTYCAAENAQVIVDRDTAFGRQ